jgi:hypothetical protein
MTRSKSVLRKLWFVAITFFLDSFVDILQTTTRKRKLSILGADEVVGIAAPATSVGLPDCLPCDSLTNIFQSMTLKRKRSVVEAGEASSTEITTAAIEDLGKGPLKRQKLDAKSPEGALKSTLKLAGSFALNIFTSVVCPP